MVRLDPSTKNQRTRTSATDTFQVRSVSQQCLIRQLGIVDNVRMRAISQALALVLDIYA